jgi:hypothetical protein
MTGNNTIIHMAIRSHLQENIPKISEGEVLQVAACYFGRNLKCQRGIYCLIIWAEVKEATLNIGPPYFTLKLRQEVLPKQQRHSPNHVVIQHNGFIKVNTTKTKSYCISVNRPKTMFQDIHSLQIKILS